MSADPWTEPCADCRADHRVLQAKGVLSIPVWMGVGCTPTEEMPPANVAPTTSRDLLPCRSLGPPLQSGERRAGWSLPARTEKGGENFGWKHGAESELSRWPESLGKWR